MDYRVEKVISLMEADPRRYVSLTIMARAVNLSPSRLRHMFKDEVGITPTQYLRSLRLRRARKMLETTPASVKEIIHLVGARDESHFMRDFKRACGQTPSEYRACYVGLLIHDAAPAQAGSQFRQ